MLKMFAGSRGAAGRGASSSFAHLIGLTPQGKKPKSEEDEACPPKGEEEGAESAEGEEENTSDTSEPSQPEEGDGEKGGKKGKKSKKARHSTPEDEGDGEGDDEEEDDSEEADAEEVKKAKAAGFGGAIRAARRMEKRRCAAILSAPQAATNVAMAASLACETDLSAAKAIAVLGKNGRSGGLSQRMAETGSPRISGGGFTSGQDPVSASWGRAMSEFMPKS